MKKLGDLFHFINGRGFKKTEWKDSGIPIIRIQNLNDDNAGFNYFQGAYDKKIEINNGDLLFSWSGTIGSSFGPHIWNRETGLLNQHIFKLGFKEKADRDYAYYALKFITEEIEKQVNGAVGLVHITKEKLNQFEIPFPPLPEQQRIVAILDEAFTAIEGAKANAIQNLKNAKELFDSYLQSVFEDKGKDWAEKTLGDVCSLYQGIAINAKTKHALVEKSDLPLLRIKDLKNNTVEQYIDPDNYPKNALVNESDIIYTRTGSLGLVFRGKRGVLHNNSFKVVPTAELNKDYLFIWLQNPIFKSKILSLALKAAQPDITHAIFKIQEIAIPPIKEQEKIVQKLDLLSAETKRLEAIYQQKIDNLEELKKSILQKAFNGEL